MPKRKPLEAVRLTESEDSQHDQIKCYAIPPLEQGSSQSEGLASYFVRLSAAHRLLPVHFLKSVIPPSESPSTVYRLSRLATVNGMGHVARHLSQRLSTLTGIEGLHYLTALPWANLFDPKGNHLLKKSRAWCPLCYLKSREKEVAVFDPLYTSFRISSVCVLHLTPLCNRCPKCAEMQPFVPSKPFIEHCHKCGHSLGEPKEYGVLERQSRRSASVWFTLAAADLIRASALHQEAITLEMFVGKLQRIMLAHAGGKWTVLAKQLGLPADHIRNWLQKGFRPALPLFLSLCRRLNCPPSSFLFESDELTHPDLWIKEKAKVYSNRKPRTEREIALLGATVRAIVESTPEYPKSLKRIATELGCAPSYLAKYFPNEVATIKARFETYKAAEQARRKAKREDRIRLAFATALSKGLATSERSLKLHNLVTPSDTRRPEFWTIRTEFTNKIV